MTIEQIVGDNIRFIRQKRNLSQEGLGWNAGISRTYIGEIERAQKNISINRLTTLAKALGVEPSLLLVQDGWKDIKKD